MKKINFDTFITLTILFILLAVPCFFVAWGIDEGREASTFDRLLATYFNIISFPVNYLLIKAEVETHTFFIWIIGLIMDAVLYAFLIERLIYFIKKYIFKSKSVA